LSPIAATAAAAPAAVTSGRGCGVAGASVGAGAGVGAGGAGGSTRSEPLRRGASTTCGPPSPPGPAADAGNRPSAARELRSTSRFVAFTKSAQRGGGCTALTARTDRYRHTHTHTHTHTHLSARRAAARSCAKCACAFRLGGRSCRTP
jgi:hypothetical protein